MSVWFVAPEERTIDLVYFDQDGAEHKFWIAVKKRLNIGEERAYKTAGWRTNDIDWLAQSFARAVAYLTGWSLLTDERKPVPVSRQTIEALDPAVFGVIEAAIDQHVIDMAKEKKRMSGVPPPQAMSA